MVDKPTMAELTRLNAFVDAFVLEMKETLARKAEEGFRGWDDPSSRPEIRDRFMAQSRCDIPNHVHVANLAMMLHRLGAMKGADDD